MSNILDISVVICVLNGAQVIGEQLDALRAQETNLRWEVIVADNGSIDDTVAIVERAAKTFPVVLRVVDASAKRGAGAARNIGVEHAGAERIAFCDSDDHVSPRWLQAAFNALETFDVVGGLNRELREPFDPDSPIINPGCVVSGSFGNAVLSGNCAHRKWAFLASGGFDTSLPPYGIEDFEMSIRLNRRAHASVGAAPEMLMYFRPTTDKKVLLRKVFSAATGEVYVWHRHADMYSDLYSLPRLVWRVIAVVPAYAVSTARGQRPDAQKFARSVVTRIANLRAEFMLRIGRWHLGEPELLDSDLSATPKAVGA